jgi:GntR family transcriptional regulator
MNASTPRSAEDIAELFRGAIRSGQLGDGERLPTVRQTARDFAVAQATAAKAYKALEQGGFVVTRTAAGTRVAPGASPAPQAVIEHVRALADASADAQVTLDDVIAILRAIWAPGGPAPSPALIAAAHGPTDHSLT